MSIQIHIAENSSLLYSIYSSSCLLILTTCKILSNDVLVAISSIQNLKYLLNE